MMLGEQIIQFKGKITGQRVLEVEGPTMETSLSQTGKVNGIQVNEMATFVGRPTSAGVLRGVGRGVIMAGGSEVVTFEGYGVGRITPSGSVKWRGSHFYRTSSTGSLAVLDNVVGVFEAEIDTNDVITEKIWEWK
jgi:hypothetical protein